MTSFGPFTLIGGTLTRDGKTVALGQRALALLEALAVTEGPVDKAALIEAAWPGTIVEDGNLTVQIAALRKALGTRPDGQEWIVTVPRVGYRLLRQRSALPADIHDARPSLAVLPFANLSRDPEQEYFADGVVDEIISALSRFKSFAVISRSSAFAYKGRAIDVRQVSTELGVRYVLEGSVRKAGNQLRITAQLADGANGTDFWSQSFDGTTEDIFEFQDRITEAVVAIVEPQLQAAEIERSRRERPESLAAYDLYLRALPHTINSTPEDTTVALALLSDAIELEPHNPTYLALAAATLRTRFVFGWSDFDAVDRERCRDYVDRALMYGRDDTTVLAHCANALVQGLKQYDRGMELARLAVEANPNNLQAVNVAGVVSLHCGDLEESLEYFQRALRLGPRDAEMTWPLTATAHIHMVMGDYAEALRWAEKSSALNRKITPTYWMLIAANAQLGRMDEARRHLGEFMSMVPGATISSIRAGQPDKDPSRMVPILEGLRLAGLPE